MRIDNNNMYITGNRAFYNYRKGIDVHGGHNVNITDNNIKGFLVNGISAVNEPGSHPDVPSAIDTSWYKWVKDVKINYNFVNNDSLWLDSLSGVYTDTQAPIVAGSFGDSVFTGGSVEIIGNTIRGNNSPISQRSPIFVLVNIGGERMDAVQIKNNDIYDVQLDITNFATDGVIFLPSGTVVPKFTEISGNKILGTANNGIKVNFTNAGQSQETIVKIHGNDIQGSFIYPYFSRDDWTSLKNNTYNHEPFLELTSRYEGTSRHFIQTAASLDSTDILSWDVSGMDDRLITYYIEVMVSNALNSCSGIYTYYAYAGAQGSAPIYGAGLIDSTGFRCPAATYIPNVYWRGTATNKTLKLYSISGYTRTTIFMKFQSWGIPILETN